MNSHTNQTSDERYLCFCLGKEEYAVPLLDVREVIGLPEVTPIPNSPVYFLGIMNLRGQVISIIDLRQKLGIKSENSSETSVIICDLAGMHVGVVVDTINSVSHPAAEELSDRPNVDHGKRSEYIVKVFKKEDQLVLILNIAKTLNLEDQLALNKANGISQQKPAA